MEYGELIAYLLLLASCLLPLTSKRNHSRVKAMLCSLAIRRRLSRA